MKRWLKSRSQEKSHRVCRKCRQLIKKHEKWRQIKRRIFGIFGLVYEIEHRDCSDPMLAQVKRQTQPEPPISQWLRENNLPANTWIENAKTETIQ